MTDSVEVRALLELGSEDAEDRAAPCRELRLAVGGAHGPFRSGLRSVFCGSFFENFDSVFKALCNT